MGIGTGTGRAEITDERAGLEHQPSYRHKPWHCNCALHACGACAQHTMSLPSRGEFTNTCHGIDRRKNDQPLVSQAVPTLSLTLTNLVPQVPNRSSNLVHAGNLAYKNMILDDPLRPNT